MILIAICLLGLVSLPAASRTAAGTGADEVTNGPAVAPSLSNLPVSFEANLGQADPQVAFSARLGDGRLYLTPSEAVIAISKSTPAGSANSAGDDQPEVGVGEPAVVRIRFDGANANPTIQGEGIQAGRTNYFKGNDPAKWRTNVPNYDKVRYVGLYDGIDALFYSRNGSLEYDFEVAPGADPSRIRLDFAGGLTPELDSRGDLVTRAGVREIRHVRPFSYQDGESARSVVESEFQRAGPQSFGIQVGEYDTSRRLTIDPAWTFSTYYGGGWNDSANAVAVDASGAAYIAGTTQSDDLPVQGGPGFPPSGGPDCGYSPDEDAFVAKFSPSGNSLMFATYIGNAPAGPACTDNANAISLATDGVVVVGTTDSSDFPVQGAIQPAKKPFGGDAFVLKLSLDGSILRYSTYFGGSGSDAGLGAAVDSADNAYVVGFTNSATDLITVAPYQASSAGDMDGFLAKINPAGSTVVYSTYFGGTGRDAVSSVAVDSSNAPRIVGVTNSTDLPVHRPEQRDFAGGNDDAFVTQFNASASALSFSTYLGGTGYEGNTSSVSFVYSVTAYPHVALDGAGNVYVSGNTTSVDFPTMSPIQGASGGQVDAFLAKYSSSGNQLFSTFLGGSGRDGAKDLAVDATGTAYVTGYTSSSNFPTVNAYQPKLQGTGDAFVTKIGGAPASIGYSTYVGGNLGAFCLIGAPPDCPETANGIAVDASANAYVTGSTKDNLETVNAFQSTNPGGQNAFLTKIAPPVLLSGNFANAKDSSVSVYGATNGQKIGYTCCLTDTVGHWEVPVPPSSCPGSGYKILLTPGDATPETRWFNDKDNWTAADCVSAPSSNNNMTFSAAAIIQGNVREAGTLVPIDGAVVSAFDSGTGALVSTGLTGGGLGAGNFQLNLDPSRTYRLLAQSPPGHAGAWYASAASYSTAAVVGPPSTANFDLELENLITGRVMTHETSPTTSPISGAVVYTFRAADGAFDGWAISDASGRYSIALPSNAPQKVLVVAPSSFEDIWWDGAQGFGAASATVPPANANFSLRQAATIAGQVTQSGLPIPNAYVSAYPSCSCGPTNAISDASGSYSLKVASTAKSGLQYRMRFIPPAGQTRWYLNSYSYGGASGVPAPSSGVNQETPP